MAKDHFHEQRSFSTVYDTFALFPTVEAVTKYRSAIGLGADDSKNVLTNIVEIKRNAAIADAVDRYFFQRVISQNTDNKALEILEEQILGAVIASFAGSSSTPKEAAQPVTAEGDLGRALVYRNAAF